MAGRRIGKLVQKHDRHYYYHVNTAAVDVLRPLCQNSWRGGLGCSWFLPRRLNAPANEIWPIGKIREAGHAVATYKEQGEMYFLLTVQLICPQSM